MTQYGSEYNQKHATNINYYLSPIEKENVAEGQIIPHAVMVENVSFFENARNRQCEYYIRVSISKEKILELARQIEELEARTIDTHFDSGIF